MSFAERLAEQYKTDSLKLAAFYLIDHLLISHVVIVNTTKATTALLCERNLYVATVIPICTTTFSIM